MLFDSDHDLRVGVRLDRVQGCGLAGDPHASLRVQRPLQPENTAVWFLPLYLNGSGRSIDLEQLNFQHAVERPRRLGPGTGLVMPLNGKRDQHEQRDNYTIAAFL